MSQVATAGIVGEGRGRREQGFSLIEVVLAIGVLSGVLLSIASMFIMGQRQVKTGKTITEATALAQDLMEAFDKQSFVALYTNLGAATTDTTFTVLTTTTGSPIAPWQTEIARKFNGEPTLTAALPTQLITPQDVNSLVEDSQGNYVGVSGYRAAFLKLWHVSS